MHYLAFDFETGGLDETKHSILEMYFVIYDENRNFIEDLYLKTKPDDGVLVYSQEALDITGIDPEKHLADPSVVTYSEAKERILKLLNSHKIKGKRSHYRPLGQNIAFDIRFLQSQLIPKEDWEGIVNKTSLDTYQILAFLKDCDMVPSELGNLGSIAEHFGVPILEAHAARDDVKMTVQVYFKMKDLMKSSKRGIASNISSDDIFEIIEE